WSGGPHALSGACPGDRRHSLGYGIAQARGVGNVSGDEKSKRERQGHPRERLFRSESEDRSHPRRGQGLYPETVRRLGDSPENPGSNRRRLITSRVSADTHTPPLPAPPPH